LNFKFEEGKRRPINWVPLNVLPSSFPNSLIPFMVGDLNYSGWEQLFGPRFPKGPPN